MQSIEQRRPCGRGAARLSLVSGVVLAAAVLAARGAAAQQLTAYGTVGADGYDTRIALAGATVRLDGAGLRPLAGLQAYVLRYGETESNTVLSVMPSVGAGYRAAQGAVEGRIGYAFQSGDVEDTGFIEGGGGRSGVVTALQGNYWGGPVELQGIASYAWRPGYSWNQAQASVPVARFGQGTLNAGAQYVFEGRVSGEGAIYHAQSLGPLLKFNTGRNSAISASTGYKKREGRDGTWYASVGVVRYGVSLR